MKSKVVILQPVIIIGLGAGIAYTCSLFLNEWAFIPLSLVYWIATYTISHIGLKKEGIKALFSKPVGSKVFLFLSILAGMIPLSIFLLNLNLLTNPVIIILWIIFAIINPVFEEIFWRGYMLQCLPFSKFFNTIISTTLFVISHPAMWGIFSIANRSWMTWVSLLVMGSIWSIVYYKTQSIWWCLISHFLVDIFNMSVFVFLNIYIPPVM